MDLCDGQSHIWICGVHYKLLEKAKGQWRSLRLYWDSLKHIRNQRKETTQPPIVLWREAYNSKPILIFHDDCKSKLDLHDIVDFNMTSNHWKPHFKIYKILHLPTWGLEKYKLPCNPCRVAFATYNDHPW
jgi:hypothetical protein